MAKRIVSRKQMFLLKCYADPKSGTWHNGTKSAIKAGYPEKSANTQASRLLVRDDIQPIIDSLEDKFYIKTRASSAEQVTLNYVHDRDLARKSGQSQAAINATTKLAEIGGLLKVRQIIEVKPVISQGDMMSDVEKEIAGDLAEQYKLRLAGGMSDDGVMSQPRAGTKQARLNPVKAIPSIDVTPEPIETKIEVPENIPVKAMNDLVREQETLEHKPANNYDKMLAKMNGGSPRAKPAHSQSNFR